MNAHAEGTRTAPRARTRTMIVIGVGILALFLIFLVAGVVARVRTDRELETAVQSVQSAPSQVYVIRPEPAKENDLTVAGTTQAFHDAIIYARASGYISGRHADIGDRVKAREPLAEIASPEVDQQLEQARADYRQSEKALEQQKATLELARVTMARYKAADEESAVAKEAVDQSIAAVQTASAAVAAAEATVASNAANVRRLQELTSFERITAPFAGTIIQRNVDVGALITAGSPTNNTAVAPSSITGGPNGLFEVAQIDVLRVFVNVPQAYAPNVRVGLPVSVLVRGRLMQAVTGTVTRTANALDPSTRTLLTEVDVQNRSHALLPGTFVYVAFKIAAAGVRWRVPATAAIFDAQGTRVVIVGSDNKLHFQPVVFGRDFGTAIDIQAGLRGDETIVKQPTVSLQEGQIVKPVPSPASGP
ncbi:MAG TPA: efflux RND transporter periplasmic adaptor subunit [Vicinamibacterales bacterium]|jgi:RND family efflux transporter MFP subunit|nr:efflux RND transporter periplasmic adaptor subunit [Vicinamibacterales bacterium]